MVEKVKDQIEAVIEWSKAITLPGLEGVPLYDVIAFIVEEMEKEAITLRASALAFNFFLALFPGIIFLFTLIPYIPVENLDHAVLSSLKDVLPHKAYNVLSETVEDIFKKRGGLLSFGFILALYFATRGVETTIDAFNKALPTFKSRSFFHKKWVALKLTVVLSLVFLVAVILIIAGESIIDFLTKHFNIIDKLAVWGLTGLNWLIVVLLIFNAIAILYKYAPATHVNWRYFSVGAIVATFLAIVTSIGFSFYINNFGQYNKLYGAIGTIIVLMLWLYFNSMVLLIGFELNTSIIENKVRIHGHDQVVGEEQEKEGEKLGSKVENDRV